MLVFSDYHERYLLIWTYGIKQKSVHPDTLFTFDFLHIDISLFLWRLIFFNTEVSLSL